MAEDIEYEESLKKLEKYGQEHLLSRYESLDEEKKAKMASSRAPEQVNPAEKKQPGRPSKPDDQKSEKTIQNREAMS